jgi:hypothetical protein
MGRHIHLSLLLLLSLLVQSCGDLFMGKDDGNDVNLNQFAQCELDTQAFSYILEKNIKGDILCLQDKLHMFMDLVDTDRPGFVSKITLKDFIENGPMDFENQGEVIDLLDAVFDLSYLILGGDKGYIPRNEVDKLVDLMVFFNQHIWKVYKYFTSTDEVNYARHEKERKVVFDELVLIANKIRTLFNSTNRGELDRINTEIFLDKFFGKDPETLQKIRDLMFLKKVFLGGQRYDLTYQEFDDALYKLPFLGRVAFDLAKTNNFNFNNDQQIMISVYLDDISSMRNLLHYDETSLISVMSIYDIMDAVKSLVPDLGIDLHKYPKEIQALKEPLLGQPGEFISNRELIRGFDHAVAVLSKGEMFFRIYDYYRDELDSTDPITHDFSDFPVNSTQEEFFLNEFSRIVNNYHFVKGSFQIPLYHHDYYRNPNGYFEIAAIEYAVTEVMAFYGQRHEDARGGYHMSYDETVVVIDKIKRFLRDFGIITIGRKGGGEVFGVTDNLVLMSTLFQYQSDGCDTESVCMEVPEITEFLLSLLAAVQVKDFFIEELQKYCGNDVDEYGRIFVDCFRRNFVNVLESPIPGDGRSLADYMPLMYQYIQGLIKEVEDGSPPTESESYVEFLTQSEEFTRTCTFFDEARTESVPMKDTDAFAVFAGLMNVESTMIRHDLNQNGYLDGKSKNYRENEVLIAYNDVFQGAIKGLVAPDGGFMEKLAKPIFQYLIKYGKVPDTANFGSLWQFVKFLLKINKRADADRTTIATILRRIGEQNNDYPFKCEECLRDPTVECEPEAGNWD